jgi:hypothetical protein
MKTVFSFLLSILAIIAICNSCKKETTPEFYYSCNLNGTQFTYTTCGDCFQCNLLGDTTFIVNGKSNNSYESVGIGIVDKNGMHTKAYELSYSPISGGGGFYYNQPYVSNYYYTDTTNKGRLLITELDKAKRIVAGTFYFNAYCAKYDSTVYITEGKFRLKYTIN